MPARDNVIDEERSAFCPRFDRLCPRFSSFDFPLFKSVQLSVLCPSHLIF
jgi:hypothetical protein